MTAPTKLIVNADDLGIDLERNRGIFEAIDNGLVTSVTLLANAPAFDDAVAGLRQRSGRVGVGVHLNITEGSPLSTSASSLLNEDGEFPGKEETKERLCDGEVDAQDLRAECVAQVERVTDAPGSITHVDAHQHVHVFGTFLNDVAPVLLERGVSRVRIPCENAGTPLGVDLLPRCNELRRRLSELGLRTTDHFRGLNLMGCRDPNLLLTALGQELIGSCELMVHPGYRSVDSVPFSSSEREDELCVLTDPGLRSIVEGRPDLTLVSWEAI